MAKQLGLALVVLAAMGCGAEPTGAEDVGAPVDDGPTREQSNACGTPIERELANLAMFVAEELGHWDVSRELELDAATGSLKLSAAALARCVDECSKTKSILALQHFRSIAGDTEPASFKAALVSAWEAQRTVDAARPMLEDYALSRIAEEPGGCGTMYWYETTRVECTGSCAYRDVEALGDRLTFAGYPTNPYLHFQTGMDLFGREGSMVGLDPTDTVNTTLPFHNRCFRLSATPWLDAYTGGDGDVVTRLWQSSDTQRWCFTEVPGDPRHHTLRHRSFSGQFLDAYETQNDHKAVLRDAQTNGSQYWRFQYEPSTSAHLVTQQSTGRRLEGLYEEEDDYRAVTRPASLAVRQRWYMYSWD